MRGLKISFLVTIILSLILSDILIISDQELIEKNSDSFTSETFINKLVSSGPILIYNDGELVARNFPGNGTFEDPFRIENFSIIPRQYGILISGVEHYFIIQNCLIGSPWLVGISIQNTFSGYGNISNNGVYGYDEPSDGICLQNCQGITVTSNTFSKNYNGIRIKNSSNCSIINNKCLNNRNAGILAEADSSDCFYENNLVQKNVKFGILFSQSGGSFVYNNILLDNSLIINENTLEGYLKYEILGNTFNSKNITYLKNLNNFVFNDTSCRNLFLINCTQVFIENLVIKDNSIGIFSYESSNCTYQNNLFSYNTLNGLKLINSNFTVILSNTFSSNYRSFSLTNSYYILLKENNFNWQGIYFEEIDSTIIETITVENNKIDGSNLSYFYKEHNLSLNEPEYGQLIFYNCSNVTISDQIIQHKENVISIIESMNFIIKNCTIDYSDFGMIMDRSQNITIHDCKLRSNYYGILASDCSIININNITFFGLVSALDIRNSNDTKISFCNIGSCGYGLYLEQNSNIYISNSVLADCRDYSLYLCDISNCYLTYLDINNSDNGIYMKTTNLCYISNCDIKNIYSDGIYIFESNRVNVMWSNISLNSYGIKVKNSSYGIYKYNSFFQNRLYGISFDVNSNHNLIYHNVFKDNRLDDETGLLSQAWDDGYNNTFYDTETYEGNWWSNIRGSTYIIAGSSSSIDVFPLNPFIITPSNNQTEKTSFSLILFLILIIPLRLIFYSNDKRRKNN